MTHDADQEAPAVGSPTAVFGRLAELPPPAPMLISGNGLRALSESEMRRFSFQPVTVRKHGRRAAAVLASIHHQPPEPRVHRQLRNLFSERRQLPFDDHAQPAQQRLRRRN